MAYFFIILATLVGLAITGFYLRKNLIRIKEKNKSEEKLSKKIFNYLGTGIWYGYLIFFFIGLTVNNLIF